MAFNQGTEDSWGRRRRLALLTIVEQHLQAGKLCSCSGWMQDVCQGWVKRWSVARFDWAS